MCAAIAILHASAGFPLPANTEEVRKTFQSMSREASSAPRRRARTHPAEDFAPFSLRLNCSAPRSTQRIAGNLRAVRGSAHLSNPIDVLDESAFGRFTVVPLVIPVSQTTAMDPWRSIYAFRRENRLENEKNM